VAVAVAVLALLGYVWRRRRKKRANEALPDRPNRQESSPTGR
jgi:hypothetical protein